MFCLSPETVQRLQEKIDSFTEGSKCIPGMVCVVVDRDGEHILKHAAGHRGIGLSAPMTFDTTFWIASCTKLITSIAAMQLVEQGKIDLDSEKDIQRILPELSDVKVLTERDNGLLELADSERNITLRMLLTHTAGFGYSFSNTKLKQWYDPIGVDEFDLTESSIFSQPLVNQPGTMWEYGIGIDWVGRLVERISCLSMGEYFRKYIFEPLGIRRTSFSPTRDMKDNLAYLHRRNSDGSIDLAQHGHLLRKPLTDSLSEQTRSALNSGGAGLFSSPIEYCKVIAMLLNLGKSPITNNRILLPETVKEMFSNQIPQFPNFARDLAPPSKPDLISKSEELYPQPNNPPQGWGLSFFLLTERGPTGRSARTGWWSGLANLIWWADLDNGIGGMFATQILPFGDKNVFDCQAEVEKEIYDELLGADEASCLDNSLPTQ